MWLSLLLGVVVLGTSCLAGVSAQSATTELCLCIDTFSNFLSRASDTYVNDALSRFSREAHVDSARPTLLDLWDNVHLSDHYTEFQRAVLHEHAEKCEV